MKRMIKYAMSIAVGLSIASTGTSQCETWAGNDKAEEAKGYHSVYRESLDRKDYDTAFENWEKVYAIAPAADGKRDYHFVDGAALYLHKFKNEADAAKKEEYKTKALALWDQVQKCYDAGTFKLSSCKGKGDECYTKKKGYLGGRQAYDMFYVFNTPYSKTLAALDIALENSGEDAEYIIFDPYASIIVYQFQKGKMDAEKARDYYTRLNAIADAGVARGGDLAPYYEQARDAMNGKFKAIEKDIFDCEYFKKKLRPEFDADPDNKEFLKRALVTLKQQGCADSDPFVMELDKKWKKYAAAENARLQAEYEANNPGAMAKKLASSGDYKGAVAKYDEAISQETDTEKKAYLTLAKASIQYGKLKSYAAARSSCRAAAKLKPNWGKPFILIGDMYGSSARSCGDSWNQRLAIMAAIDKYQYAKSVDPSAAADADKRLSKYYGALPEQQEGFMRGIKKGQTVKVGCWIGESVKVRFK